MGIDAWLDKKNQPLEPWTVLGRKVHGVVSWNMNDVCNYRCSYCTQRHMGDRTGRLQDIERTLETFRELPGHWEFKLSGGEPFRQPGLDEIVAGLMSMGHSISIQTNFSATEAELRSFLEASKGALNVFSASLHLEFATPESFVEKYEVIKEYEPLGVNFHVTSVGVPDRLAELRDEVEPFFRRHGIQCKVQPEKVRGYVREYTDDQKDVLLQLGGHNNTGKIEHNFQGKLCFSGANYIVIKSTGEAYRCYPASRVGGRYARLGSLTEGIKLADGPRICPYTYCNCTVPIQRGMIEGQSAAQTATSAENDNVH